MQSIRANRAEQPRRDPAPSRWGYRYQRLMLTPGFRRLLRGLLLRGPFALLLNHLARRFVCEILSVPRGLRLFCAIFSCSRSSTAAHTRQVPVSASSRSSRYSMPEMLMLWSG